MNWFSFDVPVDPDRPDARQQLEDELAKPEYQQAKPTWFDEMLGNIAEWFNSLTVARSDGPPTIGIVIVAVVILGLLLIAFLIFGLPRINRRSSVTGALFGEDDARTAAQMRTAAEAAAATGDYSTAIAEMFRSIARGLAERTVLTTSPGTTAHDFATRAGLAFPPFADELIATADAFDGVRYLERKGTQSQFERAQGLERQLRSAKPATLEAVQS